MRPRAGTVTAQAVEAAARLLDGVAVRTPMLSSPLLDAELGVRVAAKAENLQRTGAFKFRGAYHHVATLPPDARMGGVIGASSGNHAQALALAARLLGTRATVVIPHDVPLAKLDAIRRTGATVATYRRGVDDRDALVAELAAMHGLAVVPSADSVPVMAGAGTVAAEILRDAPDVDTLLVPLGGGGLAAGCATYVKAVKPGTRVIGVEPAGADDTRRSLLRGRRVSIPAPRTIADGLTHTTPSAGPFKVNRRLLDDVLVVDDHAIAEAVRLCFRHLHVVVEPSGATAMAALLGGALGGDPGRTAVVLSGGNVDWGTFRTMMEADGMGSVAAGPFDVRLAGALG
ncbi:pyridoxal-phosphate dependent enzyme [Yinghuangia seranimata]|uniref:pyridoxal-phosphate dependent enzyme n=1 Tax=Yinghuangia seranimata TaxID=408067 RepID=UPI00248C2192|nr:pyridoxal-phosphate dependent enzyme [Yinghuangia seranimata]MDI2129937.1 pyridoxal-phosphate dependent enzyme [Yinghuangia seranimata]